MAITNNVITQIEGLDFDQIKANLRQYMESQDAFKDYNFDGSNLTQLLNVLAYNTHYDAFLLNMQASEMTLANTTKRISTVDRAKQIGYVPRSTRSASSFVDLELFPTNSLETIVILPAGYAFQTEILGQTYVFSTRVDYLAERNPMGRFLLNNVEIVEGRTFTHKFTITAENIRGVILPNKNVDTTRIRVLVKPSPLSTDQIVYQPIANIVSVDDRSTVYFLEEIENQRYKIYFGDNVVGKAIELGNQVVVEYLVSSGNLANQASLFEPSSTVAGIDTVAIIDATPASGGSEIESIESVKISAPLAYQTQNRAVTAPDYFTVVKEVFSDIDALSVWGGQDNIPVVLGYVFISIKPSGRQFLSEPEKIDIETQLRRRFSVLAIEPVVVDPNYIFVRVNTVVKYINGSNISGVIDSVRSAVVAYSDAELKGFNESLKYSKLVRIIDQSSSIITNNLTNLEIISEKLIYVDTAGLIRLNLTQNIKPETFRSGLTQVTAASVVYQNAYYVGRPNRAVDLVYLVNGVETVIVAAVGTIAENGLVTVGNYLSRITTESSRILSFYAQPVSMDIVPINNTIIQIRPQDVSVTLVPIS